MPLNKENKTDTYEGGSNSADSMMFDPFDKYSFLN